MSLVTVYRIYI